MIFSRMDIVFIGIILLFAIIGCIRGFIKELFGKCALVLGIWVAVLFYKKLVPYMDKLIHKEFISIILSFLLIFIIVFLIVKIIQQAIGSAFDEDIFGGLDKSLGFVFGIIEGFAIVALALVMIAAQPWFDVQSLLNNSFFYRMLRRLIEVPIRELSIIVDNAGSK